MIIITLIGERQPHPEVLRVARLRNENNPKVRPEYLRVGNAIKAAREAANLSQRECARLLGVSTSTLATDELGVRAVPADRVLKASRCLNDPGLAYMAGAPRDKRKLSEPRPAVTAFFRTGAFEAWWADRTLELHALRLADTSILEIGRSLILLSVANAAQALRSSGTVLGEQDYVDLCDDYFPGVRSTLKRVSTAARAAA